MAKGTSLIVLDLRNNYGGVIQDAMLDASLFLGKYACTYKRIDVRIGVCIDVLVYVHALEKLY